MMYELKSKALTLGKNPAWVEGNAIIHPEGNAWVQGYDGLRPFSFRVNPKTCCLNSGQKDVNGQDVWSGDLVRIKNFRPHPEATFDPLAADYSEYEDLEGVVEFKHGAFGIETGTHDVGFVPLLACEASELERVENIHDPKA